MKKLVAFLFAACLLLSACGDGGGEVTDSEPTSGEAVDTETSADTTAATVTGDEPIEIELSDTEIKVSGNEISKAVGDTVYVANDIVYYEEGRDFTYGEGEDSDAHSADEAGEHKVIHITKPGEYILSGKLSKGQIAVDLGDDAEEDPNAVVTLILNNLDITCTVAPAVIFYNVYEVGEADEETATWDIDTISAGANVIIADDTVNTVNGSYVARIYKPDSVVLSEDGTEVEDAKKLHKYDAAFYSKMSMNIFGGEKNNGILSIAAENEGLDTEMHLTQYGGNIVIVSGNDGVNTNEDNVSVAAFLGGSINITVTGETGEGDGIDSNGWLIIEGGNVAASACGFTGDAGIDADLGVYINGGSVAAAGNMYDKVDGEATIVVFTFTDRQMGGTSFELKDTDGNVVFTCCPTNDFQYLIISDPAVAEGEYTLWCNDAPSLASQSSVGMKSPQGTTPPEGVERPDDMEFPKGMTPPEGGERPEGMEFPEDMTPPEGGKRPEGMEFPEGVTPPEGGNIPQGNGPMGVKPGNFLDIGNSEAFAETFTVVPGINYFVIQT